MTNTHKRALAAAALILAAGWLLYREAVLEVAIAVIQREGSSHGLFVPFLSAWFIWTKKDALNRMEPQTGAFGVFILLAAAVAALFELGSFKFQFLMLIAFAAGAIYLLLGKVFFKNLAFPLFFLAAMIPVRDETYVAAADFLRHIAFAGALEIISLFGIPFHRDGWFLHLPNADLEIAIGCSGIRYLISYFVFAVAYAYMFRDALRSRLSVVLFSIPISVAASILRLSFIFLATYYISPRMAEPGPHILLSWAVFFGVLVLSIALDQYLTSRKKKG